MGNIEELSSNCKSILPNIRKKSEFGNVINFWRENRDFFDSTMREWRNDTEGNIFVFVKEYSSLLVYFLISGNEYPGNLKADLEDLYGGFLKNMSFGGRYIVDSYVKLYNFNNTDQLKKDGEYILENIKHAKELGVIDQTISNLCKDYINKCIIYGVTDISPEFSLLLTDSDKGYFTNLSLEAFQSSKHQVKKSIEEKEDPIDILINDLPAIEDEEEVEEESPTVDTIKDIVKDEQVQETPNIEEVPDEPEMEIDVDFKEGIKIVIISSETQMKTVRNAFSQKWLDNSEKLNQWPIHLDFLKDFVLIDGRTEAPKVSIKKIAKFDMIIIGQNDHLLRGMSKIYSAGGKKDGGIKQCLLDEYNIGEGRVYFPKKNKALDFSVTRLRACLNDFMSRKAAEIPVL